MPDFQTVILEALRPHLGSRAEAVWEEGVKYLGKGPEALSREEVETLLKGPVFRALQARLSPREAKAVVQGILERLGEASPHLEALEAGLKRFQIYLDWPEVGRLRALVRSLREAWDPRRAEEAQRLLEALEERLEEALLRQAQDLAYLEESLERVRHLGGAKVRRLEALLREIRKAHEEKTLASAEVERARALALELRKLLVSSAVQLAEPSEARGAGGEEVHVTVEEAPEEGVWLDLETLPEEASRHIQAMEVEEERRRLSALKERYAPVLTQATVAPLLAEVEALLEAGTPVGAKLSELEGLLEGALADLRAERRARLLQLEDSLRRLALPAEAKASLTKALSLAQEILEEGGLPELGPLEEGVGKLEEEARQRAEEEKRLEGERKALMAELAAKGEAYAPLLQALKALPTPSLATELPRIRARYAELLRQEGELEALKAKLGEAQKALEALKPKAQALGAEALLAEAEAQLEAGTIPDLEALRARLAALEAEKRQRSLEELERLQALAERLRPLGGEAVLRSIEAEKNKPLPDPAPIARALQALQRKLEAKRSELETRLLAFRKTYGGLQGFKSETQDRLKPLAAFLEAALERLPRLGPRGIVEVEKALLQAEPLLKTLLEEEKAAQAVLRELSPAQLEAHLEALLQGGPSPKEPTPERLPEALDRLRLPGVAILAFLEEVPSLLQKPLRAYQEALARFDRALGSRPRAAVLLLKERALVTVPRDSRLLVALMERSTLSAFLQEIRTLG